MTAPARNTMKAYRDRTHATPSETLRELRKRQAVETAKILGALKAGPRTVPEIAEETRLPSQDVVWYVMTFCKGKTVRVAGKAGDGYYRYELTTAEGR